MGDHVIVCVVYSSHFISHYAELIETVTHPDLGIEASSNKDSVSLLQNAEVLSDTVSVWASVRRNIKQQVRGVLNLTMRLAP